MTAYAPSDELQTTLQQRHQQAATVALWHFTLDVSVSSRPFVALVNYDVPITATVYDPSIEATRAVTFEPWPITFDALRESADGSTPTLRVTLPNIDPQISEQLERYNGLRDMPVYLWIANLAHLSPTTDLRPVQFVVEQPSISDDVVSFSLAGSNLLDLQLPRHGIDRFTGSAVFKSARCGYRGAETYCGGTLAECEAFGALEVARGEQERHPLMWCGRSSMPTSRSGQE